MSALTPPRINTQDPGAHELSDDDHFSSASEGDLASSTSNPNRLSTPGTPITRVERVDTQPAYGEVPGTSAYEMRTKDAVPDEVEIVPEGKRSRSGTRNRALSGLSNNDGGSSRPSTPGGTPVPKTIVERVDDKPAHGEVDGTLAKEMRMADAAPDEVRQAPEEAVSGQVDQGRREDGHAVDPEERQAWFRSMWEGKQGGTEAVAAEEEDDDDDDDDQQKADDDEEDDFGEDFDDFNEAAGDDEDFGDFDEADEATPVQSEPQPAAAQPPAAPDILSGLLVSPPPMQPPNWTRSHIRRLFLVSLGVPVDLDEILPPSKQGRLVLPNINLGKPEGLPFERLKGDGEYGENASSTTSLDSKTGGPRQPKSKRTPPATTSTKRAPQPPPFDLNAAALLCTTTPQALHLYTASELQRHIQLLEESREGASGVLEFWVGRREEGVREKEVLEGVIENLVGFVRERRGAGGVGRGR